jgi:hypothetical protein
VLWASQQTSHAVPCDTAGLPKCSHLIHFTNAFLSHLFHLPQYAQASGWRSLFSGLRPAILATAASQGIYFTVYSRLRQLAVVRGGGTPAYLRKKGEQGW